ncbi:MAG: hypothetical protein RMX96_19665 [Nostoc sp. ChiSLP02]|nr:hypothetical protein [Nostoc sp. DedSLP05]MDZ8097463.1 hypothetical protein [Nostoc sp. DedSLP01]MDZ8187051.1 hypothetical protein [Nostoc sp. ChiSLP02]
MKTSVYRNLGVTACCLGLLVALVGCLGVSVSFEPANPDTSSEPLSNNSEWNIASSTPMSARNSISTSNLSPVATNQSDRVENTNQDKTYPVLANRDRSTTKVKEQGTLRMSNHTNQPVRLALLARSVAKGSSGKTKYDLPAHWDFAPQEGSEKGLVLSLPQNNLKIEKGDILVAFAQDGSRRYWGPYVVGETQQPKWDPQSKEWQLIVTP